MKKEITKIIQLFDGISVVFIALLLLTCTIARPVVLSVKRRANASCVPIIVLKKEKWKRIIILQYNRKSISYCFLLDKMYKST